MEHSAAIMADAGKAIEGAIAPSASQAKAGSSIANEHGHNGETSPSDRKRKRSFSDVSDAERNHDKDKRRREFGDSSMHHGSRGGRGRGGKHGNDKRHPKGDMGRKAYLLVLQDGSGRIVPITH